MRTSFSTREPSQGSILVHVSRGLQLEEKAQQSTKYAADRYPDSLTTAPDV